MTNPAEQKLTMKRLKGFDYRKPYFYMVTLKRVKGLAAFSEICEEAEPPLDAKGRPLYLLANAVTEAFAAVIRGFHEIRVLCCQPRLATPPSGNRERVLR